MEKNSDKMAFLISAYTEPNSLHAMIRKLNEMVPADFYIHIDKKVEIEPFQSDLDDMQNITFIKNRTRVYWGGYSQVKMQMEMIKEMLSRNVRYKRVINLTGTDYPVVGKKTMREALENDDVEYICGFDVNNEVNPGRRKMSLKYSCFYLMDTYKIIRAILIRLKLPRIFYLTVKTPIYYGSEYWALTFDCIKELYHEYLNDRQLQRLFHFSFVPSEAWVHTMFFNSDWKKRAVQEIQNECQGLIKLSPITFFKYTKSIKILDESDYKDIINSGRLFARKIITGKSDRLIAMLKMKEENEQETVLGG